MQNIKRLVDQLSLQLMMLWVKGVTKKNYDCLLNEILMSLISN